MVNNKSEKEDGDIIEGDGVLNNMSFSDLIALESKIVKLLHLKSVSINSVDSKQEQQQRQMEYDKNPLHRKLRVVTKTVNNFIDLI